MKIQTIVGVLLVFALMLGSIGVAAADDSNDDGSEDCCCYDNCCCYDDCCYKQYKYSHQESHRYKGGCEVD
jgi:hypothetical protein